MCYFIGGIYDDKNQYDSCFKYYSLALKIAKDLKNYNLISGVNSNLAKLYALRLNDYKAAYKYNMLAAEARDSFYETDRVKTLSEMTVKFETKETEAKNKLLQNENDLQKLRLQRKGFITYGLLAFIALLVLAVFLWVRQNKIRNKQEIIELEQKQLRSQMDPHFLFNCLNSIQHYIVHSDTITANKYLSEFATLVRKTLNISSEISISLTEELEYLENYLSLEKMRFENKLSYTILCADSIDKKSTKIPPMIIQPFIENAIHHGLRYLKDVKGKLVISFYKEDNNLVCTIDDNGIGIQASQKLKEQLNTKHTSHGINITQKRLALIGKIKKSVFDLKIEDKLMSTGNSGTLITIKFPM